MKIIGVIPARYDSSRFPGKPLADLGGKPMIQWVWERARKAKTLSQVIVATDDIRIAKAVEAFGGEVAMTKRTHPSGTDRIAEAVRGKVCSMVVNIQGDEPMIRPAMIDLAVRALQKQSGCGMSTLATPISNEEEFHATSVVKVVCAKNGEALYFSRAPIPHDRDKLGKVLPLKHIGLYVYRSKVLAELVKLPVSRLEDCEKLEQLRALESGIRIAVAITKQTTQGVDTPEDLAELHRILTAKTRA